MDVIEMDEQEKYLLAIMVCYGGEIEKDLLTDIVLFKRGPFKEYDKKYLRYKKITKVLESVKNKGLITPENNSIRVLSGAQRNFIKGEPDATVDALDVLKSFRMKKQLVFNLTKRLLSEYPLVWEIFPYESLKQIEDALELWRKTEYYDTVLTKCGKSIESLAVKINEINKLCDKPLSGSRLVSEFRNKEVFEKIPENKREKFRVLADSMHLVYKLRSKMGAHIDPDFWATGDVAFAALFLTLFVFDLSLEFVQGVK